MKYRESLSLVSSQLENKLDPLKGIESLGLPCIARQSFFCMNRKSAVQSTAVLWYNNMKTYFS